MLYCVHFALLIYVTVIRYKFGLSFVTIRRWFRTSFETFNRSDQGPTRSICALISFWSARSERTLECSHLLVIRFQFIFELRCSAFVSVSSFSVSKKIIVFLPQGANNRIVTLINWTLRPLIRADAGFPGAERWRLFFRGGDVQLLVGGSATT